MLDGQRILLVAAHPDDETIGCGGRLAAWRDPVILHLTDGAPRDMADASVCGFASREEYARARREELLAALALAGLGPRNTIQSGLVDQELAYRMREAARQVFTAIGEIRPDVVLTHAYEGGHPDHDSAAFAVHAAGRLLGERRPRIVEFTSYHAWNGAIRTGEFLPREGCREAALHLSPEDAERKRRMLDCFVTQRETLRPFQACVERFRPAPDYDFTRRPAEQVYYDWFAWGATSRGWLEQAARALKELGLE
jgi:LmbE family N-acetylglucosaminyl deacetylase